VPVSTSGAVSGAATFATVRVADPDPDAELMLHVAQGDQSAFKMLVQKHQIGVTNLAYRLLLDRAAAEELAQEVFLRVFRAAPRYKPTAKFSTWLYRIATNLVLNEVKSAKRSRTVALDDIQYAHGLKDALTTGLPGPEEQLQRKEMAALVERALRSLPARQRTAVVLHRFEGLSYREIAGAMDCTVEAVEALLGRAKSALKDALKGYR
jgi:RNA polymerase sigma-70 factor (ECF subfamily)